MENGIKNHSTIVVDGREYLLPAVTRGFFKKLQREIDRRFHPVEQLKPYLDGLDRESKEILLEKAWEEYREQQRDLTDPDPQKRAEAQSRMNAKRMAWLQSEEGLGFLLYLALGDPSLTTERLTEWAVEQGAEDVQGVFDTLLNLGGSLGNLQAGAKAPEKPGGKSEEPSGDVSIAS